MKNTDRQKRGVVYESRSHRDTAALARALVGELHKEKGRKTARIFGLVGNLGAGKTTFSQSFLRALGAKGKITSPTFVLVKKYALPKKKGKTDRLRAYHLDAYRLKSTKELAALGFKEIITSPHHVVLIEWADRVKRAMPKHTKWIVFEHMSGNKRKIHIK